MKAGAELVLAINLCCVLKELPVSSSTEDEGKGKRLAEHMSL
jgi:hypothetical protein